MTPCLCSWNNPVVYKVVLWELHRIHSQQQLLRPICLIQCPFGKHSCHWDVIDVGRISTLMAVVAQHHAMPPENFNIFNFEQWGNRDVRRHIAYSQTFFRVAWSDIAYNRVFTLTLYVILWRSSLLVWTHLKCRQTVNLDINHHLRRLISCSPMALKHKVIMYYFHVASQEENEIFWRPYYLFLATLVICGYHLNAKPFLYMNSGHDLTTSRFQLESSISTAASRLLLGLE